MRVVTVEEMRVIESTTFNDFGLSETTIIENVGIRLFDYLKKDDPSEVIFFIGKGNNGADGLAMARHFFNSGVKVRAFLLYPTEECSVELKKQIVLASNFGVPLVLVDDSNVVSSCLCSLPSTAVVVDAILGTGFNLPLDDELRAIFDIINSYSFRIIAIDVPSGVAGTSGAVDGVAVKATETLAIGLLKTGHFIFEGAKHSGKVTVLDVGFPREILVGGNCHLLDPEKVVYPVIENCVHKNDLGNVLVIGGSKGLSGAAILSATSALRTGAGLVTVKTWNENYLEVTSRITPEIMTGVIGSFGDINKFDSVLIGPGLGRSPDAVKLVDHLLNIYKGDLVLDADAINILSLSQSLEKLKGREGRTVLTPHIGEFARILKGDPEMVSEASIDFARDFAKEHGVFLVLKDSTTYIAHPSGRVSICHDPNWGMATAGSGDVLAGIITSLIAKTARNAKFQFGDAIENGVMIHSLSGSLAKSERGKAFMSSSDIINKIGNALNIRM